LCLIPQAAAAVAAGTGDDIGGAIVVAILVLSIGLDTGSSPNVRFWSKADIR
jgi:hypothetical protein